MNPISSCLLIGNSRWHWVFNRNNNFDYIHSEPNVKLLENLETPLDRWAAVGDLPSTNSLNPLNEITIKDIPLQKLPPWLGIDRALGAWEATNKAKETEQFSEGILVADAGTILSLTCINNKGEFAGGQLVGGLRLQLLAMSKGAKNLEYPGLISKMPEKLPISTNEAMHRGSIQALIGVINEAQASSRMPLWLCGGDSDILMKELKKYNSNNINHYPNLVLDGMMNLS